MRIVLADGTEFEGTIGITGRDLRMKVTPEIARDHFFDFSDPAKMETITYYHSIYWDVYHGFSKFLYIELKDGMANVWFEGREDRSIEPNNTKVPSDYLPTNG